MFYFFIQWWKRASTKTAPKSARKVSKNFKLLIWIIFNTLYLNITNWPSWGSTPLCATGCWSFWPEDLRQYGSALTHPAPSHWTQGPPKDVCWAPSSSLCWPTTAHRHTTLTFSLSLRMTRLWWVSLATEMRQTTGARWAAWPGGAGTTISLNVEKTNEIVVDFRRVHTQHAPLTINGATVERASSTKFLGVHITEDLSWTNNTAALAKKAQQRLYFLRKLRRARAPAPIMCTFYRGTIESILTSCITVWYGACNASCRKSLQRIVRAAEKIVGVSLPSLQNIYSTRLTRKSPQHCRWSHPPDTQLLQSAAIREETAESPGEDQQTEGQLHPSGCQEAELPPVLAPPPLFYSTQHWTLTLRPPPPSSPPPQVLPPPPYNLWPAPVTLCSTGLISTSSSIVCKLPLLTVW